MLRVAVACMFSLWEALEDGLEVCITPIRTRLTGFFFGIVLTRMQREEEVRITY